MTEIVLLATACMLGFLHALEADHMIAVTTYVSREPAIAAAARFGARWGVGHSLAVLALGGLLLGLDVRWPAEWNAAGEGAVGLMLVVLGAWALIAARRLRRHGVPDVRHTHRGVTVVGFIHGLTGTSAAVALVPITMLDRTVAGLGYLAAFGLGVTLAMTLFATAAAVAMRRAAERSMAWGRRTAMCVGALAMLIGVFWMARAAAG